MTTITKIKPIALSDLNNSEYTYFMQQLLAYIPSAETLHLNPATVSAFEANVQKMVDIVAQSRRTDETAEIAAVDRRTDDLIVYLLTAFRTEKTSPLAARRTAALALYNATHPYIGIQNLAQRQEVQQTRGLLMDLGKPELKNHVASLGLQEVVISLAEVIDEYAALLDSRATTQVATKLEAGKTVRLEMDAQYDEITTTVFAFSVAAPTADLTTFVTNLNKLIDDTRALYNQRIGQLQAAKRKKKEN